MPAALRPDIERARSLMSNRLGSGRKVKHLAEHLRDDEQVERIVTGEYNGAGLLVLTDRRLLFVNGAAKQPPKAFPLNTITGIQWAKGALGGKIVILAAGDKAEVLSVPNKDGKNFAELVHGLVGFKPPSADPTEGGTVVATATPSESIADEIAKLVELRAAGAITADEFAARRAKLRGPPAPN